MSKKSKKLRPNSPSSPNYNQQMHQPNNGSNLPIIIALLVIVGIVLMFIVMSLPSGDTSTQTGPQTATVENGKQIIKVTARGGYNPSVINAQSGIPTTLRLKTENTFDCSAAFAIPSLGINKMLPLSGVTDIEIPVQKAGSQLIGTCAMGMYSFKMIFS